MEGKKEALSVANDIAALALINIQDIFRFVLTAKKWADKIIHYLTGHTKWHIIG